MTTSSITESPGTTGPKLPFLLRALRHRNYRLFFFGQGVSLLGTWMQSLAMGWLVFRLTGSEFMLGLTGFASQLPNLVLAPMSGVFADRWDRRKILFWTQALSMCQAATLAIMVLGGFVHQASDAWYLVGMSILLGIINSVDMPVRQAFVVEMVGSREDLAAAIPLNSFLMNVTRFIGPSLAGLVVATWGEGWCFLLNSASYLAVVAALLGMKLVPHEKSLSGRSFRHELREGLGHAWRTPHIRLVLLFLAMTSLIGIPYMVLMPAFARSAFGGDSKMLGFLVGAIGIGAVCGTFFLGSRRDSSGLGRIMSVSSMVFSVALILFSFTHKVWEWLAPLVFDMPASALPPDLILWIAAPLLAVLGFAQVGQLVAGNTILQLTVEENKRGRIMSLHTVALLGIMPFGSLLAGTVASQFGPSRTVLVSGLLFLAGTLFFSTRLIALRIGPQGDLR